MFPTWCRIEEQGGRLLNVSVSFSQCRVHSELVAPMGTAYQLTAVQASHSKADPLGDRCAFQGAGFSTKPAPPELKMSDLLIFRYSLFARLWCHEFLECCMASHAGHAVAWTTQLTWPQSPQDPCLGADTHKCLHRSRRSCCCSSSSR